MTVQLHMRRELSALPELVVPDGCELRALTPDDLEMWRSLLAGNGELGEWSLDRARALFTPMPLGGAFVASVGGRPAATAQLRLHSGGDPYAPMPELDWVAALPEFRGHHLGRLVCLAVLRQAARLGHERISPAHRRSSPARHQDLPAPGLRALAVRSHGPPALAGAALQLAGPLPGRRGRRRGLRVADWRR